VLNNFENPQVWIDNIVPVCGEDSIKTAFQEQSLVAIGGASGFFGAFNGLLVQYKVTPGIVNGRAQEIPICKRLAKVAITLLLVLPWVAVIAISNNISIENPYVMLVFG